MQGASPLKRRNIMHSVRSSQNLPNEMAGNGFIFSNLGPFIRVPSTSALTSKDT